MRWTPRSKMTCGGEKRLIKFGLPVLLTVTFLVIFSSPPYILVPKQIAGWEWDVTRKTRVYVAPDNETSLIGGKYVCRTQHAVAAGEDVEFVIVVTSAPGNRERRDAIRHTWGGSHNISTVKVAFILGVPSPADSSLQRAIEEENEEYRDMIQENFLDTYNNLTLKSMMMLKWFVNKCPPTARYLMKTDDDMFVNVANVYKILVRSAAKSSLLIGSLICKARPILDSNSKWYAPRYMYDKTFYPNYLSGTGYVMSRDVAIKIYYAALSTNLIHLEDVFVTGICAAKVGIRPRNHASFSYQSRGVVCDHDMVTNHRLSAQELHSVWALLSNCTQPTTPPQYNATAHPHHRTKPARNPCH